jgi:ubiquinone/menaquinone biosynthesis C-methylase UbiE
VQEEQSAALFDAILARASVGPATTLLDVGCASGVFAGLAVVKGARATGLDASAALIEIAKRRVPDADFQVGEIERLPFQDSLFDVVTGINSFQYAADPLNALRDARRVTKPAGTVVIATWGRQERCEASGCLGALRALLPDAPAGAPGPFALSAPGALESLFADAGLQPVGEWTVDCVWSYADLDTALRGLISAGPAERAVRVAGFETVRIAVTEAIRPFRCNSGAYRLENEFRYAVATA